MSILFSATKNIIHLINLINSIFFSPKQRTAALLSPDGHYRMFYLHLQPSCRPVAGLSGCESNRGTITREIISSVLSGYAPRPVTSRLLCCPPTSHFSFSQLTHPCFCLFCLFLFFSGGVYVGWGDKISPCVQPVGVYD